MNRRQFIAGLAALPMQATEARKYALLDPALIAHSGNAQVVPGGVTKDSTPLFAEDKPWEVRIDNVYANVMLDGGVYRSWYSPFIQFRDHWDGTRWVRADAGVAREMAICYAESRDGVHWEKPDLGLAEFEGSRHNNIVWRGPHGAGIFRDPHESDPDRRYKIFYNKTDAIGTHQPGQSGMRVAFSRNGLNWSEPLACPQIEARGDTHNNAFWDARSNQYIAFTRLARGQRIVGRTESPDFIHWTKAEEVLMGDPARQTYAMPVFPYCQGYLGLVMVFDTGGNTVDCELAWSRDTRRWERIAPSAALIPRGPEGSHDHGCIFAAAYPIQTEKEILLFYGGNDRGHNGPRRGFFCRARLRPDGFAGLAPSSAAPATVLTQPIEISGRRLRVCVDAARGSVRIGIAGSSQHSLESCRPITSDGEAVWTGRRDLASLRGRKAQVQIELRDATLFTLSFLD